MDEGSCRRKGPGSMLSIDKCYSKGPGSMLSGRGSVIILNQQRKHSENTRDNTRL